MAGFHQLEIEESNIEDQAVPPTTSSSSSSSLTLVNSLLQIAREKTVTPHVPVATQPDYIPLPPEDSVTYTIDSTPSTPADGAALIECPEHLKDMLVIVRNLREARLIALQSAMHAPANTITPAQEERVVAKTRLNNYARNLSDLMESE